MLQCVPTAHKLRKNIEFLEICEVYKVMTTCKFKWIDHQECLQPLKILVRGPFAKLYLEFQLDLNIEWVNH